MSANPGGPSFPPLSAIQDPNVRAALQALYTAWQVRSGQVGSGDYKWLTEEDVGATVNQYFTSAAYSVTNGGSGGSNPVQPVIDAVTQMVLGSREWAALQEKITLIQTPDWLRDALRLAIQSEVSQISTLAARLNYAEAGIGRADSARVTLERSVVESFKQLVAKYGDSTASITDLDSAVATYANSSADRVTQLSTTMYGPNGVSGVKASAEQAFSLSSSINDKASALYTLKVSTGNVVTGMAIGSLTQNGTTTSNIVFSADQFAVGNASYNRVPFVVNTNPITVNGQTFQTSITMDSQVFITSANIQDAAITTAKIGTAQVDTLQIKGQAVTVPFSAYTAGEVTGSGSLQLQSLTVENYGESAMVTISSVVYSAHHESLKFILKRNGTTIYSVGGGGTNATKIEGANPVSASIRDTPGAGTHTYTMHIENNGNLLYASGRAITYLGVRR